MSKSLVTYINRWVKHDLQQVLSQYWEQGNSSSSDERDSMTDMGRLFLSLHSGGFVAHVNSMQCILLAFFSGHNRLAILNTEL